MRATELASRCEALQHSLKDARNEVETMAEAVRAEGAARLAAEDKWAEEKAKGADAARSAGAGALENEKLSQDLALKEAECAQLKALVHRMEASHADGVAKADGLSAKLAEALRDKGSLGEAQEHTARQLSDATAQVGSLRELIASLDAERDALSAAVDAKAEEAVGLRQAAEKALGESSAAERTIAELRGQASHTAGLLASLEGSRDALQAKVEGLSRDAARLTAQRTSDQEELANVTDDLSKMIRENQLLNEELQKLGRQAERASLEATRSEGRASQMRASVDAAKEEREELVRSYKRLTDELSASKAAMASANEEKDGLRAQMGLLEEGYAELQSQVSRVQQENGALLLDLHAYEAQNATLVQRLEELDTERLSSTEARTHAEQQLASTRLVLGGVERSREMIQRDSAAAGRAMQAVQGQLREATAEKEALSQQLRLAKETIGGLERLAAELRVRAASSSPPAEGGGGGGAGAAAPSSPSDGAAEGRAAPRRRRAPRRAVAGRSCHCSNSGRTSCAASSRRCRRRSAPRPLSATPPSRCSPSRPAPSNASRRRSPARRRPSRGSTRSAPPRCAPPAAGEGGGR